MTGINKIKESDIKNCTCNFFDAIINIDDPDHDDILLDEKYYEHVLIYHAAYKTPWSEKPLHIIFDRVDGYIRKQDKTEYLALFHSDEKYDIVF